jgi:hypothetical protein
MIKRYNQFVKGKVNEDYGMDAELEAPVIDLPSLGGRPPINPPTEMESEFEGEEEEVATDKYEIALQNLADAAGVDFTPGQKSVVIGEKEITFPAETEKYHIKGVKKSFTTPEDVLANLGGHSSTPTEQKKEVKDEMTSLKDEEIIDSGEQFESKSYKAIRRRTKR